MLASFADNRSGYSVTVTGREVERFASRWPCSGLLDEDGYGHTIVFDFDKNGDLVDVTGSLEDFDGSAMVALSNDAQLYAQNHRLFKELHLPR